MDHVRTLTHTLWDWKDHLVWIPKSQRKVLYEQFIRYLGPIFKEIPETRKSFLPHNLQAPTVF